MNLDKSDLKILTAHELGCRLDDVLEAQGKEQYRLEGGVKALQTAAASVDTLNKALDEEIDKGLFDLEQAKTIKRYIQRAHQMITNLMLQTDNMRMTQHGRVAGLALAVDLTKKFKEDEAKRVETLRLTVAQNKITANGERVDGAVDIPKVPGIRPGMTLKERRLAEEKAEKETADLATAATVPPPAPETVQQQVANGSSNETSVIPIVKKRGRPRKVN